MLKDLLEKFDKEFDEKFSFLFRDEKAIVFTSRSNIKSLAHSHIEAAYQSNLEKLIEKCGDKITSLERGHNSWWAYYRDENERLIEKGIGSTPTEAVENLIKALKKPAKESVGIIACKENNELLY